MIGKVKTLLTIVLVLLPLMWGSSTLAQENELMDSYQTINVQIENDFPSEGPGVQYIAVNQRKVIYEYVGGIADIANRVSMNRTTTMAAFSMTKTLTAIAILQLADARKLRLDEKASLYVDHPYDPDITITQLLNHTSGIPNPLPLRWVHLAENHSNFDESLALKSVLEKNPKQSSKPGEKYLYSNIGYWLLGKIVEAASKQPYPDYVRQHILEPLKLKPNELDFVITRADNHAHGYLEKYSMMNLVKGFLLDDAVWGGYEGKWLRIKDVYLNGPSFGGAIGSASAFSRILQDLLGEHSVILPDASRELLFTQTRINSHLAIDMTLGWHIGEVNGIRYFFKEGGGRIPQRDENLSEQWDRYGGHVKPDLI